MALSWTYLFPGCSWRLLNMKVLFLDIDGVVNCSKTMQRHRGVIGIDPYMALLVDRIVQATGCEVVLSSTWRLWPETREEVKRQVCQFIDTTPQLLRSMSNGGFINGEDYDGKGGYQSASRGYEIQDWLDRHPEVTQYAILDDDSDMLAQQKPNFFKTTWDDGLNEEIANRVIAHLNDERQLQESPLYQMDTEGRIKMVCPDCQKEHHSKDLAKTA